MQHTVGDLTRDLSRLPARSIRDMKATVREGVIVGNTVAKDNARRTAGRHGKHYPKAFTWEMSSFYGFGGGNIVGEYGPVIDRPQGGMSFEGGSRNQPPHNDLAKSADLIGPVFQREVRALPDRWFW